MRYIYDCSPGNDALVALLIAAANVDLAGVTTVCGNAELDQVSLNALGLLELAGLDGIPVAKGASRPLLENLQVSTGIHGELGIGQELPTGSRIVDSRSAVDLILETSHAPEGFALLATGPMTNIATALAVDPTLVDRVAHITTMGGSLTFGNSTPVAEYNIWVDPEAAAKVYRSGIPIRMFGLNVTRQANATREELDRIRSIGSHLALTLADTIEVYRANLERIFGYTGASLHDALPAAYLVRPELFQMQRMHVDIELDGTLTRGMTVCDYRRVRGEGAVEPGAEGVHKGAAANAEVCVEVEVPGFFDLLNEVISAYAAGEVRGNSDAST